jgi:hypothetical protein
MNMGCSCIHSFIPYPHALRCLQPSRSSRRGIGKIKLDPAEEMRHRHAAGVLGPILMRSSVYSI